jgi:diamine N-acetyltransferase
MRLRVLKQKDAELMLEWMHDPSVVANLQANFFSKTIEDCKSFIAAAQNSETDLHMAIADDEDTYMGTVSLKHIHNGISEFAITVRTVAMGKGYAQYGMREMLEYGITQLMLKRIYWCVSQENQRAVRFYDKNGYIRTTEVPDSLRQGYSRDLIWYVHC